MDSQQFASPRSASVLSVNLGRSARSEFKPGLTTGIDKRPVDHPVQVTAPGPKHVAGSGLAGDDVCDRRHHGGNDQAVYAYAREDLDAWAAELGRSLPNGGFGENLTTVGIDISNAIVGERWQIGATLVLEISDPRIPCRTFAGFLRESGWIKRFIERGDAGTYLRVLTPGPVAAGDGVSVRHRPDHGVTVATVFRAFTNAPHLLPQLIGVDALSEEAKSGIARRVPVVADLDASF
ncbi:MAG: MOSC domain-containing protein [Nakamurella sp.]